MNIEDVIKNSDISATDKIKLLEEFEKMEQLQKTTVLASKLAAPLVKIFRIHLAQLQGMSNGTTIYTQEILNTIRAASISYRYTSDID